MNSSKRWQTARAAYKGNAVTRLFKTLRDMSDGLTIKFDDTEFVRSLGGMLRRWLSCVPVPRPVHSNPQTEHSATPPVTLLVSRQITTKYQYLHVLADKVGA